MQNYALQSEAEVKHLSKLIINGVDFPDPEGSFDVTYSDEVNEYDAENGKKTIEIIRKDVAKIDVGYNGIPEEQLNVLIAAINTSNNVSFYSNGKMRTAIMMCKEKKTPKKYIGNGQFMRGLSFTLEEL